jgi:Ca2+/Na+ antiporter
MTLEIFFIVLGVLIAIYSLAPESDKTRLLTFVNPRFFLILIPSYVIILLICFYIDKRPVSMKWKNIAFITQYVLLLIFFLFVLYIYLVLKKKKLTKGNIERFYKRLHVLLEKGNYVQLTDIIHGSLSYILDFFHEKENKRDKIGLSDSREAEISQKIFRDIIFNKNFIQSNVHYGKQFSIDLISECINHKIPIYEYVYPLIREMMKSKDSILYSEIIRTQTRYFPEDDKFDYYPFLNALFNDIRTCDEQAFYGGVGEYVLEFIVKNIDDNNILYNHSIDFYNRGKDYAEKYKCPIYIGLLFFKLMVRKGIRDNYGGHLWLFYLKLWVKEICSKMKIYFEEWHSGKIFPSIYYYLLDEILMTHREWIKHIYEVSGEEKFGRKIITQEQEIEISRERKHVFKCILIDLNDCIDYIAQCPEITNQYKKHLLSIYFKLNIDLDINFRHYDNPTLPIATNISDILKEHKEDLKRHILNKNFSQEFNNELYNSLINSASLIDIPPLGEQGIESLESWKKWLNSLQK